MNESTHSFMALVARGHWLVGAFVEVCLPKMEKRYKRSKHTSTKETHRAAQERGSGSEQSVVANVPAQSAHATSALTTRHNTNHVARYNRYNSDALTCTHFPCLPLRQIQTPKPSGPPKLCFVVPVSRRDWKRSSADLLLFCSARGEGA